MENTENAVNLNSNALNGWQQKCKQCSAITEYDQYSVSCERCGSKIYTVFYKCPECEALTGYGSTLCTGCKKKISDLMSNPCKTPEDLKKVKSKRIRLMKFLAASLLFSSLIYAVGLNIFIAIVIGVLIGVFCMFL